MNKIRKYQVLKMLEIFKEYGYMTIEDIKNILNKDLKNDTDIVFQWKVDKEIEKAVIKNDRIEKATSDKARVLSN